MCLRSVALRATGSARRVARVALSILAKAALVGAKMVAGAIASTVSYSSFIFIYVLIASSMPHLCDISRRHSRYQGREPLIRHEGGQQCLWARGGDGDRGQEAWWAPSDIHRGGQRGHRGSVNRHKGIGLDMGRGVFSDSWSVFCGSWAVLWGVLWSIWSCEVYTVYLKSWKRILTTYLLWTFFLTTVFLKVGFEIPILRMGSRMFLNSGEVSASSVSCPPQNPAKVRLRSRNETRRVILRFCCSSRQPISNW